MNVLQEIDGGALLDPELVLSVFVVIGYSLLAFTALRIVVVILRRVLRRRTTAQVTMLITKGVSYLGFAIIVSIALLELGVNLTPVLGAAGIVGLAVGVASQASLSNMISGLFLVSEKPFSVGDVIKTTDTVGVVESIDLLSVKIRTFDNLFIRVPNEKLAATQLTNITRYPIRRVDIRLVIPFDADLVRVGELLISIAAENPDCLQEPAPLILPDTFVEYGTELLFGVWFAKSDFLKVKSALYAAILKRFSEEGIELAMPRGRVYLSDVGERPSSEGDAGGAPTEESPEDDPA
ncbi:MAG: mechanosensitive ion channel family protein [Spirochaetota bacterium]